MQIGLTGTPVVAAAADVSTEALRGRRAFGGSTADVSALSARTVDEFVLTGRRGRTVVGVSFAAVLDFVRRGKLGLSVFDN